MLGWSIAKYPRIKSTPRSVDRLLEAMVDKTKVIFVCLKLSRGLLQKCVAFLNDNSIYNPKLWILTLTFRSK